VCLDNSFRDVEPEAGAGPAGLARLPEAIEEMREILCWDTRPGVRDGE